MKRMDEMMVRSEKYQIITCEKECMFHPSVIGLGDPDQNGENYILNLMIDDYKLKLLQIVKIDPISLEEEVCFDQTIELMYSGTVLIARDYIKNYFFDNKPQNTCFSYHIVKELVFVNGVLVTTIEHNKAMLRIRKNLELGYRKIYKTRDFKCIEKFIRSTLVGDYDRFKSKKKRMKYYESLRDSYKLIERENE